MSGQHVVYGFLRPFTRWMRPTHEMVILHYESEQPPKEITDQGIETICLPDALKHWAKRTYWEATKLPAIVRQQKCDLVLTVSGAITPNCPVPQVTLCQNPWCYVSAVHQNWQEKWKAKLQRIGYAKAYRNAAMMIYISGHLRDLYRRGNQGVPETRSEIAWVGLNEDTFEAARQLSGIEREPYSIVSVSAMASWKGAETLITAVKLLRDRQIPATLKLVGPWPDSLYEHRIRQQIEQLSLENTVSILGKVSNDDLHRLYATSEVFSLMSSCESFGIPAAEAMAFGTPIVSTDCCAIAEICEPAGTFGPVGDPQWTANALAEVLTNDTRWSAFSAAAVQRAAMLTWENCAKPLLKLPELAVPSRH
jgi:glycosyltransferase involved in cell wall biosynthesis